MDTFALPCVQKNLTPSIKLFAIAFITLVSHFHQTPITLFTQELFWTCEHFTSNGSNRLYLHARVNCAVRDLDLKLFKEAILLRRAFVSRMMETT
jgi:hypothetical protein